MAGSLTFTVGELNQFVKRLLEYEQVLNNIKVKGEISNYSVSGAGHVYFTLKDEDAAIRCVWFNGSQDNSLVKELKDGLTVVARGAVSLYVKGGEYQLIVNRIELAGKGYWYEKFLALKQKLDSGGLFSPEYKKQLPTYPQIIGVVTSQNGAAIEDIYRIINERYPLALIRLYPVAVQGQYAASQISKAVDWFSRNEAADVLIVGRGGGSIEDLWPFNEEVVARSVFNCRIPVVSAVGHESDFTICDFVADVREATPSSAAARITPNGNDLLQLLASARESLQRIQRETVANNFERLTLLKAHMRALSPQRTFDEQTQRLDFSMRRLHNFSSLMLQRYENRLMSAKKVLNSLNPDHILSRGYTMIKDHEGTLVTSASAMRSQKRADVVFHDGSVPVEVLENKYE